MCDCPGYWARVKRIPLTPDRDTDDGEAVICRTYNGSPVRVTKPEYLGTDDKRAAAISLYEEFYAPPGKC